MTAEQSENMIENPAGYFEELGGLHDARINEFSWDKKEKSLSVVVDDINSNFLDLPEYKGEKSAELIFSDVSSLDINTQIDDETFGISDLEVTDQAGSHEILLNCTPGGSIKFKCKAIVVRELS